MGFGVNVAVKKKQNKKKPSFFWTCIFRCFGTQLFSSLSFKYKTATVTSQYSVVASCLLLSFPFLFV